MSLITNQDRRIAKLLDKGISPEEAAFIENIDLGYVRSLIARRDTDYSPTASRRYFGREIRDEEE